MSNVNENVVIGGAENVVAQNVVAPKMNAAERIKDLAAAFNEARNTPLASATAIATAITKSENGAVQATLLGFKALTVGDVNKFLLKFAKYGEQWVTEKAMFNAIRSSFNGLDEETVMQLISLALLSGEEVELNIRFEGGLAGETYLNRDNEEVVREEAGFICHVDNVQTFDSLAEITREVVTAQAKNSLLKPKTTKATKLAKAVEAVEPKSTDEVDDLFGG